MKPPPKITDDRAAARRAKRRRELVVLAVLTALVAGAAAGPAAEPEPVPSPVYACEDCGENPNHAGNSGGDASSPSSSHWRFVPLSPGPKHFPTDAEFSELAQRCRVSADDNAGEGEPRTSLLSCLGDRGFYRAQCSDGLDNDGDGLSDYGNDPGCAELHALSEAPECDDKLDNDGDGLVDWGGGGFTHPDPECVDLPAGVREAGPSKRPSLNPF